MAPAQAQHNNLPRPETDYERWLREQDKNYELQEDPVYEPNSQNQHDTGDKKDRPNSHGTTVYPPTFIKHQTPSIGHEGQRPLGLERYSAGSKFLFSVLLVLVIVRSVRSFRRRARPATAHEKA
ncbi:hypothetical protein BDV19DRAFT_1043 [Aspergillus venezuelensis]